MSPDDTEWPALLHDYKSAIAEFESASRELIAALTKRNAADGDLRSLLAAEERAREAVILARMRLINLWRDSGAELQLGEAPLVGTPIQP